MNDGHTDMCLLEVCLVTVVASVDKVNDKRLDVVAVDSLCLAGARTGVLEFHPLQDCRPTKACNNEFI